MRRSGTQAALAVIVVTIAAQASIVGLAGAQTNVPPPTPVPPDGSPSPFPSALQTPRDPVAVPDVRAQAAILADLDDGTVLYHRDANVPRPVASLTKVMTALLVLERAELDDIVRIDPAAVFGRRDFGSSSSLGLRAGERITVADLLEGLLLGSANDAAEALAIHVSGSVPRFVALMDRRAAQLGMRRTSFASPHGLDDRGRSTASDLLILVRAADATPGFTRVASARFRRIPAPSGPARRIQNRNALLWLYEGAFGFKTGFTVEAGPCLIAAADREGRRLVAIVLGAEREAFSPAATLLDHGFEGFTDETFVREGEDVGVIGIRGGEVPVLAGASLQGLIPTALLEEVRRVVLVERGAAFPPAAGETVAMLQVRIPGRAVGSVPLVVASVPPPAPEDGTWWTRGLAAVSRAIVDAAAGLTA